MDAKAKKNKDQAKQIKQQRKNSLSFGVNRLLKCQDIGSKIFPNPNSMTKLTPTSHQILMSNRNWLYIALCMFWRTRDIYHRTWTRPIRHVLLFWHHSFNTQNQLPIPNVDTHYYIPSEDPLMVLRVTLDRLGTVTNWAGGPSGRRWRVW